MATRAIGDLIDGLMDRGDLPRRIRVVRAFGPAARGDEYVWVPEVMGYTDARGRDRVIPAFVVRMHFGRLFEPAGARQEELTLCVDVELHGLE